MAIPLSQRLDKTLNTSGRLTNNAINPDNLSKLDFSRPFELKWNPNQRYTEAQADSLIDKITADAEEIAQDNRILDAETHRIKLYNKKQAKMKALRKLVKDGMLSIEESYSEWQLYIHQVEVAKRKAGLDLGAGVEEENIGYEAHRRQLTETLNRKTDSSRGGSESGSYLSRRLAAVS